MIFSWFLEPLAVVQFWNVLLFGATRIFSLSDILLPLVLMTHDTVSPNRLGHRGSHRCHHVLSPPNGKLVFCLLNGYLVLAISIFLSFPFPSFSVPFGHTGCCSGMGTVPDAKERSGYTANLQL